MAKKLVNNLRKSLEMNVQNHHATVIQAAFRGHLAREKAKGLRHSNDSGEYDEEEGEGASEYGADETETEEDDEYYDDEEYYDSEEEMETEVEISEMEELAEEMEILTVKSPTNMSKYSKTDMGGQQDEFEEEE